MLLRNEAHQSCYIIWNIGTRENLLIPSNLLVEAHGVRLNVLVVSTIPKIRNSMVRNSDARRAPLQNKIIIFIACPSPSLRSDKRWDTPRTPEEG